MNVMAGSCVRRKRMGREEEEINGMKGVSVV